MFYTAWRAGMVKSVRGVAYAVRVAPAAANRMVDGSRGVLNELLADVRVFTDHRSGAEAGASPGYGLTLVAQTTTGRLISAQAVAPPAAKVHPHEVSENLTGAYSDRHACRQVFAPCAAYIRYLPSRRTVLDIRILTQEMPCDTCSP